MFKFLCIIIFLVILTIPVFAQGVEITKEISYYYVVNEEGNVIIRKETKVLKDGKDAGSKYNYIKDIKDVDKRGLDILETLNTQEFKLLTKAEKDVITGVGIEENITYQIEVLSEGQIQVRRATRIFEDGVEISKKYHRHVLAPGDDLTGQPEKVIKIAQKVWTDEVVKEFLEVKNAKRGL